MHEFAIKVIRNLTCLIKCCGNALDICRNPYYSLHCLHLSSQHNLYNENSYFITIFLEAVYQCFTAPAYCCHL